MSLATFASIVGVATMLGSISPAAAARPNLLFMMADQLRYDAVGYANVAQQNKTVFTPALDRLAAEGVGL